ncbi:MAG: PAS domain-containing protein [Burkholderiales bacterium]|nr:PAS domain-containing protein [Burkholderiales bacterium]
MHKSYFGAVIKRLRVQQGLTQEQLASLSDLERTFVSMLERGIKQPSLSTISNVATAFGIKTYELLHLVEQEVHGNTPASSDLDAQQELRQLAALEDAQEKERVDEIANAIPVAFFARTPMPEYAATFVSKNIQQLLGYEREAFLGSSSFWLGLVHPEDRPAVLDRLAKLDASKPLIHDYRIRAADGRWRDVREELKLVPGDSGSAMEILVAMMSESVTPVADSVLIN